MNIKIMLKNHTMQPSTNLIAYLHILPWKHICFHEIHELFLKIAIGEGTHTAGAKKEARGLVNKIGVRFNFITCHTAMESGPDLKSRLKMRLSRHKDATGEATLRLLQFALRACGRPAAMKRRR